MNSSVEIIRRGDEVDEDKQKAMKDLKLLPHGSLIEVEVNYE